MATYEPVSLPEDYNSAVLQEELSKISYALQALEAPLIQLVPQNVVPTRTFEGMIVNADGTNWNPGAGQGIYAYLGGAWVKL